jgi:DeoR/GlpR family transcriptional regulator of sugar metabolism
MQRRDLMPAERQKEILERLRKDGRVLATHLAREFSTSEDTIRRVLRDLAAQGLCARVYGGALAISPASGTMLERKREAVDRKLALGQKLASIVLARSIRLYRRRLYQSGGSAFTPQNHELDCSYS